jgi:FtsP/CotA-like multicopper oxidase with cupredoxin domain
LEWIRIGRSGRRGPRQVIPAGTKWEPHFTINQPAATLWFHPHVIGTTAIQVYYGLTGLLIVEDENSEALNLPNEYGVKDIHFIYMVLNFNAPNANEQGWKDTVYVGSGETVRIIVKFKYKGIFMYHCHILEHEEVGMMGQLKVQ